MLLLGSHELCELTINAFVVPRLSFLKESQLAEQPSSSWKVTPNKECLGQTKTFGLCNINDANWTSERVYMWLLGSRDHVPTLPR